MFTLSLRDPKSIKYAVALHLSWLAGFAVFLALGNDLLTLLGLAVLFGLSARFSVYLCDNRSTLVFGSKYAERYAFPKYEKAARAIAVFSSASFLIAFVSVVILTLRFDEIPRPMSPDTVGGITFGVFLGQFVAVDFAHLIVRKLRLAQYEM